MPHFSGQYTRVSNEPLKAFAPCAGENSLTASRYCRKCIGPSTPGSHSQANYFTALRMAGGRARLKPCPDTKFRQNCDTAVPGELAQMGSRRGTTVICWEGRIRHQNRYDAGPGEIDGCLCRLRSGPFRLLGARGLSARRNFKRQAAEHERKSRSNGRPHADR